MFLSQSSIHYVANVLLNLDILSSFVIKFEKDNDEMMCSRSLIQKKMCCKRKTRRTLIVYFISNFFIVESRKIEKN